jgi:hypothetical protein
VGAGLLCALVLLVVYLLYSGHFSYGVYSLPLIASYVCLASLPLYLVFVLVFFLKKIYLTPVRYIGLGISQMYDSFCLILLYSALVGYFELNYLYILLLLGLMVVLTLIKIVMLRFKITRGNYKSRKNRPLEKIVSVLMFLCAVGLPFFIRYIHESFGAEVLWTLSTVCWAWLLAYSFGGFTQFIKYHYLKKYHIALAEIDDLVDLDDTHDLATLTGAITTKVSAPDVLQRHLVQTPQDKGLSDTPDR